MTNILILTGAGISAESGLSTFRDTEGLWKNHAVEEVCSAAGLATNPYQVHAFYDARRAQLPLVSPNPSHIALAELEAQWIGQQRGQFTLCTQNVDDLHERGGSRNVLHVHGELASALCMSCGQRFMWKQDLPVAEDCPVCDEGALRPDVVLFGEAPYHRWKVEDRVARCDVFIAIGTSGNVHPAAGLVRLARQSGAETIEVNLRPTANADFRHVYEGPASRQVSRLVQDLLARTYCTPF